MVHVWFQYFENGKIENCPKHYSLDPKLTPNPDPDPTMMNIVSQKSDFRFIYLIDYFKNHS